MSHTTSRGARRRSAAGAEPEAPAAPGARFCTNTSAPATQAVQELATAGVLRVQRERLLVAVHPHEVRAEPLDALVVAAGEVAHVGPLDLDDPRAEVGELPGGVRGGDRLLQ
jgi:hypothetical protein